jgi:putative phosphoribosyl transferase
MSLRSATADRFEGRRQAGRALADRLQALELVDPIVIALPRGGVPVGFEVAEALGAPLDILLVRKVGAPGNPELAVGAIADDGQVILDAETIAALRVSRAEISDTIESERRELERRRRRYRGDRLPPQVSGRTVVLVDDGLATGSTAVAASRALRGRGAARVILAVPVSPLGVEETLGEEFDEIVAVLQPARFFGVGRWYRDFSPTTDAEVIELLAAAGDDNGPEQGSRPEADPPVTPLESAVEIDAGDGVRLQGDLRLPAAAKGLIVFAHGSGSSRRSVRNREVASNLNAAGFATLLLDLLSERESIDRENVFDVDLLADRLLAATAWADARADLRDLPIGYFGASTGAAAALAAAAADERIGAVVSRGGRPDLAGPAIGRVEAPTLLIVGGADRAVLRLNELALSRIRGPAELAVVPGAGHLFEEPGALRRVAELAAAWFEARLTTTGSPGTGAR